MKSSTLLPILATIPSLTMADTSLIDTSILPSVSVYEVAELTPLAVTTENTPAVVLLSLDAGDVVPPHATEGSLRLLTVLSGDMSWGDGSTIDETQERIFGPGSVLTVPAGLGHWLAARSGPVQIQLILLDDEKPVPGVQEQMQ
ncbi:hypothetical protein I5535_19800 [Rhodobacteraceae bacterium F11138]|nr:hypothetical protein [Rhodobacteraceae bacterium F11138]